MGSMEEELPKAIAELAKDVGSDLIRPTSRSIGNNIGLLVDGVMGWLGYLGEKQKIKQKLCLESYKQRISQKILAIPEENLVEPPLRIIGPAIEASKFYIEEKSCREMFAQLIASACDKSVATSVHPSFPKIIEQLTVLDAKFLTLFKKNKTYPAVELTEHHSNGNVTPVTRLLFDFKDERELFQQNEEIELTKTIENLSRFGLIVKNSAVVELGYDYNNFKSHWLYIGLADKLEEGSTMKMKKYRIEPTQMGWDFLNCCVPNETEIDDN